MKEFLEWLTTGKTGQCRLVNNLDDAIQKARKHEEWRLEYMTLLMRDQEMMKKGREEGLITGREQGRNQTIFTYVYKGRISLEEGAQDAGMSISDFKKAMTDAGFNIPTND